MKSLFKTVTLILIFSVLTRALGFLFRIYLSRSLGAENLGIYQVSMSIFGVLLTIVSSGLPLVISKQTAKYKAQNDLKSERQMLSCSLVIGLVSSITLTALVLILNKLFGLAFTDDRSVSVLLILLPAIIFNSVYSVFRGSLWGENKYFGVCVTELFEQVARIIIAFVLLEFVFTSTSSAIGSAVSLTLASMLSCVLVIIIYFSKKKKLAKPQNHYKEMLKSSIPITAVRLATSLVQPLIAIILPLRLVSAGYSTSQAMQQYGIASGMTLPLLFIPNTIIGALCMALIPDISTAVCKQDSSHIDNRVTSSITFSIFISCLFIPLYIGAGEHIGNFFYDSSISGLLLMSGAWIMLPLGLINISSSLLNALGLEMKSLKNYILGAILMLLSLIFLPKFIGVKSLAFSMGICTLTASILNIKMLNKHLGGKIKILKPLLTMIIFMIPTAAITSFISNILVNFIPLFFVLMISCLIGALFFVLLCVIFNVINLQAFLVSFKEKYKIKIAKKSSSKA